MSKRIAFTNVTGDTIHDAAYEVTLDGELVGRVVRSREARRVRHSEGRLGRDGTGTYWHYEVLSERRLWVRDTRRSDARDRAVYALLTDEAGLGHDEARIVLCKPAAWV